VSFFFLVSKNLMVTKKTKKINLILQKQVKATHPQKTSKSHQNKVNKTSFNHIEQNKTKKFDNERIFVGIHGGVDRICIRIFI